MRLWAAGSASGPVIRSPKRPARDGTKVPVRAGPGTLRQHPRKSADAWPREEAFPQRPTKGMAWGGPSSGQFKKQDLATFLRQVKMLQEARPGITVTLIQHQKYD